MKVKVGSTVYDAEQEPIMLLFNTDEERLHVGEQIINMPARQTGYPRKYVMAPTGMTTDAIAEFMSLENYNVDVISGIWKALVMLMGNIKIVYNPTELVAHDKRIGSYTFATPEKLIDAIRNSETTYVYSIKHVATSYESESVELRVLIVNKEN